MDNKFMEKLVFNENDKIYTTSLIISKVFEKRHDHIMRDIRNLQKKFVELHLEDTPNFGEIIYKDNRNRHQTMFTMDREGFIYLVTSFTGDKALIFRNKFINAFNKMEAYIKELEQRQSLSWIETRENGKIVRKDFTSIISNFIEYAVEQGSKHAKFYYKHYTAYINKMLYGIESTNDIDKNLRDQLDVRQLSILTTIEIIASKILIDLMEDNKYYKQIYKEFKEEIEMYSNRLGIERPALLESLEYQMCLPKSKVKEIGGER